MTISTTDSSIPYNGNGVTLAFPVPFRFLLNGDISTVLRSSAGVVTPLSEGTHYTLTGAGNDEGGTLTMIVAPAVGETLIIDRIVALTQETDYPEGGNFPAEAHERALDRLTMITQQQETSLGYCLALPDREVADPLPPVSDRASRLLGFDALGRVFMYAASMLGSVAEFAVTLATSVGASLVGFQQSGTGATLRTVQAKGQEYASFKDFGCVCDGVTDDSANFEKAIQTGRIIRMDGETILIASPVSNSADTIIQGRGTLKFAVTTQTAITCTGSVHIAGDITFDGTDVSNELIRASGPRLVVNVSEVKNIFQNSVDGVRPIRAIDVDHLRVFGTAFKKIGTPANGTVGDSQGAVQAVLISGSCKSGKVYNCSFSDINNRATAGGVKQFEDSDAVLCATSSLRQNVSVYDCEFEDIGKRFMKATGTPSSVYRFNDNQLSSAYVGTVDDAVTVGNGMFSAFSCYGGRAFATDNTFIGGITSFFFDADFADFRSAVISDNIFEPEIHTYANTSFTRFVNVGTSVPILASLTVNGNDSTNTYYAVISYATRNAITTNPRLESGGIGVDLLGGGTSTVTGNTITQHASWNATTTAAYGVIIRNGAVACAGSSNAFVGKYDAWNVASQSSACRLAFSGNSYQGIVRNDITNNAAATYVAHFANAGSTTALYSSINALTSTGASAGGGGAVPATVLGFERKIINGVSAKIPYFAV
jgi:hypothetical protein